MFLTERGSSVCCVIAGISGRQKTIQGKSDGEFRAELLAHCGIYGRDGDNLEDDGGAEMNESKRCEAGGCWVKSNGDHAGVGCGCECHRVTDYHNSIPLLHKWHKAGWDDAIRETKFLVEFLEEISKAVEDHECYGGCTCHYVFPGQAKDALLKYRELVGEK